MLWRPNKLSTVPTVPLEPQQAITLAWSLMFLFSENEPNKKLGQEVNERINALVNATADPNGKSYLIQMINAIFGTVRVLAYRATGMRQYIKLFNDIEEKKITELNNLASITAKPASLVPRVISAIAGGALGSISLPQVLEKAANFTIPSYGPLSGYELFIIFIIFGSSIGYTIIELLSRIYRMYALPKILSETQNEKSLAWNRFVRESREAMRNLLLNGIKLREKMFPTIKTFDGKKMSDSTISPADMEKFNPILNSIIALEGPQVRNQLYLRPNLFQSNWKNKSWKFRIRPGDIVSGSFSTCRHKNINFRYYEVTNKSLNPSDDPSSETFQKENIFAYEFSIVSKTDGWGIILFENRSLFRSRQISFSCEILNYSNNKFCS